MPKNEKKVKWTDRPTDSEWSKIKFSSDDPLPLSYFLNNLNAVRTYITRNRGGRKGKREGKDGKM